MKKLPEETAHFLKKQGFAIVSTLDRGGAIHNACKGIVKISPQGEIYLLDLYQGKTYHNLKDNRIISIAAVDEHTFTGYSLKGKAEIIPREDLDPQILKSWDDMIVSRVTRRLLKNIREEKGHPSHPEMLLPEPKYMIKMEVGEIIDLTPKHLKTR